MKSFLQFNGTWETVESSDLRPSNLEDLASAEDKEDRKKLQKAWDQESQMALGAIKL